MEYFILYFLFKDRDKKFIFFFYFLPVFS